MYILIDWTKKNLIFFSKDKFQILNIYSSEKGFKIKIKNLNMLT